MSHPPVTALLPIVLLALAFVVYCLVDLVRQPSTRGLPKAGWAVVILVSIPLGGIIYLLFGRDAGSSRSVNHGY